ncbi:MAG: TonB-dependent receptor [Deltaproteobacteria bacterium]|nr:MAG: TonB-dependent receptor [Deltaproteobacteria bacterium]
MPSWADAAEEVEPPGDEAGEMEEPEDAAMDEPPLPPPTFSIAGPRARTPHAGAPSLRLTPRDRAERPGATWDGLLEDSPGVRSRSFGPAPERPIIRGFDGERILVLEDGQRMGDVSGTAEDHALSVDPLSVVEIEVIRGPISVLYGGNAIGGVVDIRRASLLDLWPDGTALTLRSTVSSVDRGVGLHLRGAQGGEHLAIAVRASGRAAGDLRTPEGRLEDTASLAGELGADLGWRTGPLQGELRLGWRGHVYGLPEGEAEEEEDDDDDERVEIRLQRLRASHELLWQQPGSAHRLRHVTAFTAYVHDEIEIETEEDGTVDEDLELRFDILSHSQRLELHTRGSDGLIGDRTVGLDADIQRVRIGGDEVLTPDAFRTRAGLFGVQELVLSPAVAVPIGLRGELTHITTRANEAFNRDLGNLPEGSELFPDAAASIGVRVSPTHGLTLGLQGSRAFRAPLVEELYSDAPHLGANAYEIGDPDLRSEVVHGADVWARFDHGPLRLDASAFIAHVSNYIVRAPTADFDPESGLRIFLYGSTDATLAGGELAVDVDLPANLALRLSADAVRGSEGGLSGTPLPSMPPAQLHARLGWHPGAHFVRIRTTTTTAQNRTAPDEDATPAHALLGGEIGTRFDALGGFFTAVLRIDNALDTAYQDHLSRVERRDRPMPGRNIQLSLSGEW